MVIYGIDQIFSFIGGHGYDKCNRTKGLSATLFLSDHFRRHLYEEIGFYFKHKEVDIQDQYPWLARFTENIDRDAPNQAAIYRAYVAFFPRDIPSREEILNRHLNHPIQNTWLIADLCSEEVIPVNEYQQDYQNDHSTHYHKGASSYSGTSHEQSSSSSSDHYSEVHSQASTHISQIGRSRESQDLYVNTIIPGGGRLHQYVNLRVR